MQRRIKNSISISAFSPGLTKYHSKGYHPELQNETVVQRTERVVESLGDLVDGFEYHYPGEINEKNLKSIQEALAGDFSIYCISSELPKQPEYLLGGLTNPEQAIRTAALKETLRAIELCAEVGAAFNYWAGGEGFDYPFQINYQDAWRWEIEGLTAVVSTAHTKGVRVFFETKAYGPSHNILIRDVGRAMFLIKKMAGEGVDVSHCGVNLDWQHLHMNREGLAECAYLLASEGMLAHQHINAGWGIADEANLPGTTYFMRTLEMAVALQDLNYGGKGERIGYDFYPGFYDGIAAMHQAILQWEFIYSLAAQIDRKALRAARARKDAISAYREVYKVLGLNKKVESELLAGH